MKTNPDYYRQRQQITEHPFGTLKRQRGFTFTLVKGKEKVLGEVGLEFIAYNLSRCVSLIGIEKLVKALKECCFEQILAKIRPFLSLFTQWMAETRQKKTTLNIKLLPVNGLLINSEW